jgi:probable phosphoglycerate mutase
VAGSDSDAGDRPGADGSLDAGVSGRGSSGPRRLVIRTDGASRNNPGHASCGAVLIDADGPDPYDPDAPPVAIVARALGVRTNNVAEYAGLVLALREARRLGAEEIDLRLDSKLIVEQLTVAGGKDAKLQGLFAEARRHLATFVRWSATHEPRERNRAADALANLALDDPEAAAMLVAEVARRNGREPTPPPAVDTP